MVNMNKRYADYDSDDDHNSSDEDNGNFKRRRRRHSSGDDFVTKTLQSFTAPEVSKPLKVITQEITEEDQQLIQKQRVLNEKLSKLPKYDDLFDTTTDDCIEVDNSSKSVGSGVTTKTKTVTTTIELSTEEKDVLAGGDCEEVSKPKATDPRLRRMDRFKAPDPVAPIRMSEQILLKKINDLLNNRKPSEAYIQLKAEVTALELHKYMDVMMVMAKDWFPSQIDNAMDPRSVFIEPSNLNSFQNLLKDIFSTKIKSKEFWESIIFSIEKFVNESRIRELPQFMTKLRWIMIRDIRDYLVTEEVRIGLKASTILVEHKVKLDSKRERHRRQFEATAMSHMSRAQAIPTPVAAATTHSPAMPIIVGRPTLPSNDPRMQPKDSLDGEMIGPFQSTSAPFSSCNQSSERRTVSQILECLTNDQYFKLIQMLDRHTRNQNSTFIENIGQALKQFVEKHPKMSIFTIYQKLHDSILLHSNDFKTREPDNKRLDTIFEKTLKQFHETVIYNPKEWILIRDHTRTEKFDQHFTLKENPFNEPFFPIQHNIVVDCGYISNGLIINYLALEEEIPLMAQNIILKDPRMELKSEAFVNSLEVVDLDDTVVGNFSPIRSDTSPSTSPEYTFSGTPYSDSNSDTNVSSPEPHSGVNEPNPPPNAEAIGQKTENANPVRKVLTLKSKTVKTGAKKVIPLKNKNSNKTLLKKRVITEKTKPKLRKSPTIDSKSQNAIKISGKPPVSAVPNIESPNKETRTPISAPISPKCNNGVNPPTVNPLDTSLTNTAVVPQKRIIKLNPKSIYNELELKKIIRRVSISSDDSDSE